MFNPTISYWYSYICRLNSNSLFCIFYLLYVALFNLFYYFYWIEFSIFSLYSCCLKSCKMYFYCFSGYPSIWNRVLWFIGGFSSGTLVKNPAANAGDAGLILEVPEDLLEEEMATHSSTLAWEIIPWTNNPCQRSLAGCSPWGHTTLTQLHNCIHTCTHTHCNLYFLKFKMHLIHFLTE